MLVAIKGFVFIFVLCFTRYWCRLGHVFAESTEGRACSLILYRIGRLNGFMYPLMRDLTVVVILGYVWISHAHPFLRDHRLCCTERRVGSSM